MSTNRRSAEYGSDVVVDLMKSFGIEYVALNPGSTFRGIHESIVNYGGNCAPEVIECCHEEISVAIAHGYARATGRPMAAIVHNVVGLQHASMAIYNAWCDRVPVMVLGGTGPMDTTRRRPWIDWVHTALVQGNLVRDYVKWDDQPYSMAAVPDSFIRAYRIAVSEPSGPVYLCYDVDLQENVLAEPVVIPEIERYAPPPPLPPNSGALQHAAELLVGSKNPVIIVGTMGRNPAAVAHLVELAELLAAPVLDRAQRFNFPNTHPLDLSGAESEVLRDADVVLALDVRDLSTVLGSIDKTTRAYTSRLRPHTTILNISLNDLLVSKWGTDYYKLQPADVSIVADTAVAIPQLVAALRGMGMSSTGASSDERGARFEALKAKHNALREGWKARSRAQADDSPITQAKLAADVWDAISGEDWALVNGTLNGWARRLWDIDEPNRQLGGDSGGGGLGSGIGAALGASLALRNTGKLSVNLQNDGDFLVCSSALWTAAHHRVPMLMVMNNNRSYYNSEEHQEQLSRFRGRDESTSVVGTRLDDPAVDFAALARSFGLYGEGPIERPDELVPAIRRAAQVVKERRMTAIVDVVTRRASRGKVE